MPRILRKQITKHFYSEQETNKYRRITRVFYKTPEMDFGRDWITIVSHFDYPQGQIDYQQWEPATVNWFSLGAMQTDFVMEWSKAMSWAAREAARFDRKGAKLNAKINIKITKGTQAA